METYSVAVNVANMYAQRTGGARTSKEMSHDSITSDAEVYIKRASGYSFSWLKSWPRYPLLGYPLCTPEKNQLQTGA